MFVVLDTNVIVSALLSPTGRPSYVFKQVLDGDYILCCDARILREYEEVLKRPKFRFNPDLIADLMNFIRTNCLTVTPKSLDIPFEDVSDRKFFEVAKYCNAVLITGNLKHFPNDPIVKSVQDI
ncbi:MAG: putative toxin-antitoxin system toxin component, PIN family [Candidatus Gallimonas sp.]